MVPSSQNKEPNPNASERGSCFALLCFALLCSALALSLFPRPSSKLRPKSLLHPIRILPSSPSSPIHRLRESFFVILMAFSSFSHPSSSQCQIFQAILKPPHMVERQSVPTVTTGLTLDSPWWSTHWNLPHFLKRSDISIHPISSLPLFKTLESSLKPQRRPTYPH